MSVTLQTKDNMSDTLETEDNISVTSHKLRTI